MEIAYTRIRKKFINFIIFDYSSQNSGIDKFNQYSIRAVAFRLYKLARGHV